MTGGIFISYRRDDAKHAAGRLVDRLITGVGRDKLFLDVDNIEPGLDFVKVLNEEVAKCDVLLALIGPQWLEARDAKGNRRIDNPADFVRIEIEAALARDIRVVPVLLDGAELPVAGSVPPSLEPLRRRNAVRISHERFASEADDLATAMKRALGMVEVVAAVPGQKAVSKQVSVPLAKSSMSNEGASHLSDAVLPNTAAFVFAITAPLAALKFVMIAFYSLKNALLAAVIATAIAALIVWFRRRSLTRFEAICYWFGSALPIGQAIFFLNGWTFFPGAVDNDIASGLIVAVSFFVLSGLLALRWWQRRQL